MTWPSVPVNSENTKVLAPFWGSAMDASSPPRGTEALGTPPSRTMVECRGLISFHGASQPSKDRTGFHSELQPMAPKFIA